MADNQPPPAKQPKRARELDTANATKGVWLVKVPNYLSEAWKKATPSSDLGVMKISSDPRAVSVSFTLSDELSKQTSADTPTLPREHRVVMQPVSTQTLSVFSEGTGTGDKVIAEGRVTQRADIRPPVDSKVYMALKQHQIRAAGKTKNTATKLEATPVSRLKPVTQHPETKPTKNLDKRARDDRDKVLTLIFDAFQAHQYYTFKDLVHITKQPPTYLKELLREVCVYNTKAPHKNTWELKPEYRHHSKDSPDQK